MTTHIHQQIEHVRTQLELHQRTASEYQSQSNAHCAEALRCEGELRCLERLLASVSDEYTSQGLAVHSMLDQGERSTRLTD